MSYYLRAFGKSPEPPSLGWLRKQLSNAFPHARLLGLEDRTGALWETAELQYNAAKTPIALEMSLDDGPESVVREECEEFVEEIGRPLLSRAKARVLKHLEDTRFILACRLPGDVEDEGYNVNGALIQALIQHHGCIIQADGEGFYEGARLVVRLA